MFSRLFPLACGSGAVKSALRIIVSGVLLFLVYRSIDVGEAMGLLLRPHPYWVLAAILWIIGSMVISADKWLVIMEGQGLSISWREAWDCYWVGIFFNNFMPSSIGGDAFRIWRAGKAAGSRPGVFLSVIFERLLALSGLALLGLAAAAFLPGSKVFAAGFLGLVIAGIILAWMVTRGISVFPSCGSIRNRILKHLIENLTAARDYGMKLSLKGSVWIRTIFWSLLFQIAVVMIYVCVFRAIDLKIGWIQASFAIPAISAFSMIPVSINGSGLREGAAIALLAPWGIHPEAAATSSFIFGVLVSITSLYGGVILALERMPRKEVAA